MVLFYHAIEKTQVCTILYHTIILDTKEEGHDSNE